MSLGLNKVLKAEAAGDGAQKLAGREIDGCRRRHGLPVRVLGQSGDEIPGVVGRKALNRIVVEDTEYLLCGVVCHVLPPRPPPVIVSVAVRVRTVLPDVDDSQLAGSCATAQVGRRAIGWWAVLAKILPDVYARGCDGWRLTARDWSSITGPRLTAMHGRLRAPFLRETTHS